jgi:hypothetical protein
MSADELLVRFLEEGAPLSMAERASGIPATVLQRLPLSRPAKPPTQDELGELGSRVARKALEVLMDDLATGNPAVRLRAATSVVGHPLRHMRTDASGEVEELKSMVVRMLQGELPDDDEILEVDR